jgi:hypothetical protein
MWQPSIGSSFQLCSWQAAGVGAAGDPGLRLLPWQERLLTDLRLLGAGAQPSVTLGESPPADRRLLAATRILCTGDVADIRTRSPADLGEWDKPLSKKDEAGFPPPLPPLLSWHGIAFSTWLLMHQVYLTVRVGMWGGF